MMKSQRISQLKIYLVGGAVRDELMKLPVLEKDWVVVGSTPEEMRKLGYQPVGKDFPVFLHPKTHEEYALARTERKTGKGYKGFHFYATPDVTLEEDLTRRDLTINAIAQSDEGKLIDPYHGHEDICKKILRHVSPAFSEDPVRILRVARFAARFTDFTVAPETNELMKQMAKSGEVDALVSERVWKELSRALVAAKPERFFEILKNCNALPILFPEFKNTQTHLDHLNAATVLSPVGTVRFATLLAGLSEKEIQAFCTRFRAPTEYTELALLVARHREKYRALNKRNAESLWEILKCADAFRRPERFQEWITACHAVEKINHAVVLEKALTAAKSVDPKILLQKNLKGPAFAEALRDLQIAAMKQT